jgi:hypothetical protein
MIIQRLISSKIIITNFVSEFAALQTAVSDLTSDLIGGNNALFREYDVYASKTLFSSQKSDILMNQQSKPVSFQILHESTTFSSLFWRQDRVLYNTFSVNASFTVSLLS